MAICSLAVMASVGCGTSGKAAPQKEDAQDSLPKVYMYREITPENLVKIYRALGREATGRVAVKLSTGEPGGHNFLSPSLVSPLVKEVNGTIVECNTAYAGRRTSTEEHLKAAEEHGFTAIAPVDIMDADGEVALPVSGGKHLKEDFVGKNFLSYDFTIVLSHFKGHAMGGFGGLYISVANNLSVDCDCDASPEDPRMGDIGILASLDPVALDRACTDLVRSSDDPGKVHLIERIDSRNGMHTLDYAEQLGMGSQAYELIVLD